VSLDITRFCKGNIHRYFRVFILILSSVSFTDVNHWRSLFVRVRPQSPEISTRFSHELRQKENSDCQRVEKNQVDRSILFLFCIIVVLFFSFRFLEYLFAHRLDEIPGKMN
jgi:hypothetical protein